MTVAQNFRGKIRWVVNVVYFAREPPICGILALIKISLVDVFEVDRLSDGEVWI